MVSNIDDDRIVLKQRVEAALDILKGQHLIQKNSSIYVFLTDEEQEIDREIESQDVQTQEVIAKVSEMIFEDIFDEKKYRYPALNGRYAFPFNQAVDDRPYKANQSYDVGIRILTPAYDGGMDDATLRMMSGQGKEVVVLLPDDRAFIDELRRYLKIEKFLRLNTSSQLAKYETIKEGKRVEMRERNSNAKLYLTESLKEATIYVNGDILNVSAKEVAPRLTEAIGRLVQTVYHKLSYIDAAFGEADLRKMFRNTDQTNLGLEYGTTANRHALDDVLSYIAGNTQFHTKTSMKSVRDRFMKAPYGFVEDDVNWLVAELFRKGNLSFTVNGAAVTLLNKSADDIISYITKKQYVEKLLMEQRENVPENHKKTLKLVTKELFGVSSVTDDEDALMSSFESYAKKLLDEMEKLENFYTHYAYPGKKTIQDGKKLLQSVLSQTGVKEFYEHIFKMQDALRDLADDYEPVKTFFGGEQQQIFMRTLDMLEIYEDSKTYIVDRELEEVVEKMREIIKKAQPYGDIHKLPDLCKQFRDVYQKVLEEESVPVMAQIDDDRDRVIEVVDTKEYKEEKRQKYMQLFVEIHDGAESCNNVSVLRSYADKADALKIRLLNEMDQLDIALAKKKAVDNPHVDIVVDIPAPKKTKNITIKHATHTSSWRVESEGDIDKYLAELKKTLMDELDKNDIVNIEF
jgi:hypothetical protein